MMPRPSMLLAVAETCEGSEHYSGKKGLMQSPA